MENNKKQSYECEAVFSYYFIPLFKTEIAISFLWLEKDAMFIF